MAPFPTEIPMLLYAIIGAISLFALVAVGTLTATNLYINWSNVTFPPTVGSPVTISKVTDVRSERGGNPEYFKGDLAVSPQCVAVPDRMRTITVPSGDIDALMQIGQGTFGAIAATLADAINGIAGGGGGKTYALAHCVVVSNSADAAHSKFGSAQLVIAGFDPTGGSTEILTTTAL